MSKKFGILAYPAGHSLSPAMHRAAFQELGIDATYDFFEVPPGQLEKFFTEQVRTHAIDGLSVSIPHKVAVMPLLDEIEDSARKIGAVNTVFWKDKKLCGTNTDWIGADMALMLGKPKTTIWNFNNKEVVVLGGGGAARAIVFMLLQHNCSITVITREEWEFAGIKKDFGVATDFISNLGNYSPEILINTTPLGMKGKFEGMSFAPESYFKNHKPLVFDIVYNPRETQLLKDAHTAGCETIEGLEMLVRQAMGQLKLWLSPELWQIVNDQHFEKLMWDSALAELAK